MRYHSTRSGESPVPAAQALLAGAAPDGGLYVPQALPRLPDAGLVDAGYGQLAAGLMAAFFPELMNPALTQAIEDAYARFDDVRVAPLAQVGDSFVLELFHGPTAAFKDLALQALPPLLARARDHQSPGVRYAVLTATSGDTGSAAMRGFRDLPGFSVLVYYPDKGISPVQRAQMTRMPGQNLACVGIAGNFDDAQAAVKEAFRQQADFLPPELALTSANSINIGRLIPQMAYYISACRALRRERGLPPGQAVDFIVPTGNFGDILAGYLVKRMGWPIGKLVCVSNENRVLTDFLKTGCYDRNRELKTSLSPSMDILVSSNLERLLYYAYDGDARQVGELMNQLRETGRYQADGRAFQHIQAAFTGASATDEDTLSAIARVYRAYHYLMDPHTATAWLAREALGDRGNPRVVLATASPFKFPETALRALGAPLPRDPASSLVRLQELTGQAIPPALKQALDRPVRHRDVVARERVLEDIKRRIASC